MSPFVALLAVCVVVTLASIIIIINARLTVRRAQRIADETARNAQIVEAFMQGQIGPHEAAGRILAPGGPKWDD